MEFVYDLAGGAPILKKLAIGETWGSYAGIPVELGAAEGLGVMMAETTTMTDVLGVSVDTGDHAYSTSQTTDGSDAMAFVTTIINPLAVYRAKLSGAATEGTALTIATITTASSDGLLLTCSGNDFETYEMDEGTVWGYSGANAGLFRFIDDTPAATSLSVITPFHDTAVGDEFLYMPLRMNYSVNIALTTNLYQVNTADAAGDGGAARVVDQELRDKSMDGRTNSFVHMLLDDHIYNQTT